MTRAELADFWDQQLDLWLGGQPLSRRLDMWRGAYRGIVHELAFPEPYIGDLLGSPRIVLLANNPGVAHPELQSRDGTFAARINDVGFTRWAATRPYEGSTSPWVLRHGEIRHNWDRIRFARRLLGDESMSRHAVLNVELFPWHSPRLGATIQVDPQTFREFLLEPLAEFGPDVPVVALGVAWSRALDRIPTAVVSCDEFSGFSVVSRRARLYTMREGGRILVVWHKGSDKPPKAADTVPLRSIWFGDRRVIQPERIADALGRETKGSEVSRSAASRPTARSNEPADHGTIRSLVDCLNAWVDEEFAGVAVADTGVQDRVRLRVHGRGARIGWDVRSRWVHVWVKNLREGEQELLDAALQEPVKRNADDSSFRARDEADFDVLRDLIRRHVQAERAWTS